MTQIRFGFHVLKITRFVAKIMDTNDASLKFFRSMNFEQYEHDDDFDMTHLHRHITQDISDSLLKFETFAWVCKSLEPMSTRTSLNWIGIMLNRRKKEYECCSVSVAILMCYHYLRDRKNTPRTNNFMLHGTRVKLVPYSPWHVETYHEWMKDPYILKMTASEPLTMRQEYAMQKMWNEDSTKRTFIVLDSSSIRYVDTDEDMQIQKVSRLEFNEEVREVMEEYEIENLEDGIEETAKQYEERESEEKVRYDLVDLAVETVSSPHARHLLRESVRNAETKAMAGDVNIFLQRDETVAELSIMIVPERFRRRGLATESLRLMMRHAMLTLGILSFVAKITKDNTRSIKLFQERLGFEKFHECNDFNEIHFRCLNIRSLENALLLKTTESPSDNKSYYSDHLRRISKW